VERERHATEATGRPAGFTRGLGRFLRQNKKWWLTPLVLALLVLGLLAFLGGRGEAPFIYTLF
jgi:hypothetical protein